MVLKMNICSVCNAPWCKEDPFEQSVIMNFYGALGLIHPKEHHQNIVKQNIQRAFTFNFVFEQEANRLELQDEDRLKYLKSRYEENKIRGTGKTTRAILHFIYHRFFLEQDCCMVDFADAEYNRKFLRKYILETCEKLQSTGMLSNFRSSDIIIHKSSDPGWWPSKSGKIIYHSDRSNK